LNQVDASNTRCTLIAPSDRLRPFWIGRDTPMTGFDCLAVVPLSHSRRSCARFIA
jgi:hypothetical protein